jgi:hypothetical protein
MTSSGEMNVEEMIKANKVWIPSSLKDDFIKKYGNLTLDDFDRIYDLNNKLGATYDNSWSTVMHVMNLSNGNLGEQFEKLRWATDLEKRVIYDLFNFVSNLLRCRIEEEGIWYLQNGETLKEM